MIRLSPSEQPVWDAFFVSVTAQLIQQAGDRGPEYIAERAAEITDEMLLERRERCADWRSTPADWVGPA